MTDAERVVLWIPGVTRYDPAPVGSPRGDERERIRVSIRFRETGREERRAEEEAGSTGEATRIGTPYTHERR